MRRRGHVRRSSPLGGRHEPGPDPLAQLPGRHPGEGDDQQAVERHPSGDVAGHQGGDGEGLARPGARLEQRDAGRQRPADVEGKGRAGDDAGGSHPLSTVSRSSSRPRGAGRRRPNRVVLGHRPAVARLVRPWRLGEQPLEGRHLAETSRCSGSLSSFADFVGRCPTRRSQPPPGPRCRAGRLGPRRRGLARTGGAARASPPVEVEQRLQLRRGHLAGARQSRSERRDRRRADRAPRRAPWRPRPIVTALERPLRTAARDGEEPQPGDAAAGSGRARVGDGRATMSPRTPGTVPIERVPSGNDSAARRASRARRRRPDGCDATPRSSPLIDVGERSRPSAPGGRSAPGPLGGDARSRSAPASRASSIRSPTLPTLEGVELDRQGVVDVARERRRRPTPRRCAEERPHRVPQEALEPVELDRVRVERFGQRAGEEGPACRPRRVAAPARRRG